MAMTYPRLATTDLRLRRKRKRLSVPPCSRICSSGVSETDLLMAMFQLIPIRDVGIVNGRSLQ